MDSGFFAQCYDYAWTVRPPVILNLEFMHMHIVDTSLRGIIYGPFEAY